MVSEALRKADTVIVPGYDDVTEPASTAVVAATVRARPWGAPGIDLHGRIALAAAGLLDGRPATRPTRASRSGLSSSATRSGLILQRHRSRGSIRSVRSRVRRSLDLLLSRFPCRA